MELICVSLSMKNKDKKKLLLSPTEPLRLDRRFSVQIRQVILKPDFMERDKELCRSGTLHYREELSERD